MSCVALLKAMSQKKHSEPRNHHGALSVRATPARAAPTSSCMTTIHQRLVRIASTNGLHSGLMTHGR